TLSAMIARRLGVSGAAVLQVPPGSAGARAGLRGARRGPRNSIIPGDVIVAIGGKSVESVAELGSRLDDYQAGDSVKLTVWREGKKIEVQVRLQSGDERAISTRTREPAPRTMRRSA